jgi:hypothetical protein
VRCDTQERVLEQDRGIESTHRYLHYDALLYDTVSLHR